MTDNKPKKPSRRSKAKYPALNKHLNLSHRHDFLVGPEYVNGVYNNKGEQVIRPMTDEEREFLNKFESEVVVGEFKNDGTDLYTDEAERKTLRQVDYARRYDIYNFKKRTNMLVSYDVDLYDDFVWEKLKTIDCELLVVNEYEREKRRKELEAKRLKKGIINNADKSTDEGNKS